MLSSAIPRRVQQQAAFVLHRYPYKESSLILDVFTREYGRVGLLAKGARRPSSQWRGLLLPFTPLLLSFSGKSELATLTQAEWQGGLPPLRGCPLLLAFYLNELLLKLLQRYDGHPRLFDFYHQALLEMYAVSNSQGNSSGQGVLPQASRYEAVFRRFEFVLLQELGYALDLPQDTQGHYLSHDQAPLVLDQAYFFAVERGILPCYEDIDDSSVVTISGLALMKLENGQLDDEDSLLQAKRLMRYVLSLHLGSKPLRTRQMLVDLQMVGA